MIDPISLRITMQHVRGFLCSLRVAIINRNSPAASRLIVRLLVTVIRKKEPAILLAYSILSPLG